MSWSNFVRKRIVYKNQPDDVVIYVDVNSDPNVVKCVHTPTGISYSTKVDITETKNEARQRAFVEIKKLIDGGEYFDESD